MNDVTTERYDYFSRIAQNRFDWMTDNPIYDSETIEKLFFDHEYLGVWHSEQMDMPVMTPVKMKMEGNFLGMPIVDEPILVGKSLEYRGEDITWCYGDRIAYAIILYCVKLKDIQLAKDQQIWNQRAPAMAIAGDRLDALRKRISVEKFSDDIRMMLIEDGVIENVKALDLGSLFNVDRLDDAQIVYENRILARLGLDNSKEKKERLIVDEQEANDETIGATFNDFLRRREKLANAVGWVVRPIDIERIEDYE